MKRKMKEIGRRISAIGLSVAMAGSSLISNVVTTDAAATTTVQFDSEKFLTQAMKHLGDGYSQENRMASGTSDCTSFVYKTLKECGFDGGSGIYASDNTIPASTDVWIDDIINNALVIKDADGKYVETVYANTYAEYQAMKDDSATYGGKLIVCKQAVDTATLASADLPAGTIVITQATSDSPAHAQIVIGKPGTNDLPANFTSAGGNDYYTKLTAYMNSFFGSLQDMYGLTNAQISKMVVIPAETSGAVAAVNQQNALTGSWKYANWGYFDTSSFTSRREDAIACLTDGNGTSLNNINWVIDSASTTYGTRLRMGITGKGGSVVNAYLVTPVAVPDSTSFTVTKQGKAVTSGTIKSITFQLKADGGDNVKYSDKSKVSATTATINFNYGTTAKSYTWNNLLKYNDDGTEIKYSAVETKVVYKNSSGVEKTVTQTSSPSISEVFSTSTKTSTTEEGTTEIVDNSYGSVYGRFAIKKVDDEQNPVGATFYVYSDIGCSTYLGQFTCGSTNGSGNYSTTWASTDGLSKTVYFKEYDADGDGYITVNNKTYKVDPATHAAVMAGVTTVTGLSYATWTIDGKTGSKTIENDEYISHTVTKTLSGNAASYVTAITVQLYRNVAGGTSEKYGSEVTLNAANSWSHTWGKIPKCDSSNAEYHYYAVETSVSYKTADGTTGILNTEADLNKYFTRTTDNAANSTTIKSTTNLTNSLITLYGAVQIEKVDKENETVKIAGVEYGVFADPDCTEQIESIITDENGTATYTTSWCKLDGLVKTVYIKELQTISPYVLDPTVYAVVITGSEEDAAHSSVEITSPENVTVNNNGDGTKISVYQQDNEEKYGQINVIKTGEVLTGFTAGSTEGEISEYTNGTFTFEQRPMAGAEFELKAAEDISNRAGTVTYKKDEVIETKVSGADGKTVFGTDTKLPMGTYILTETKAPAGQTIPEVHEWTITLTYDNSDAGVVSESRPVDDSLLNASVSVEKVDAETKSPLSDTYFGLYATVSILNVDGAEIVAKDTLIAVVKTDESGSGTFAVDIPYGEYYVKELQAKDGYKLSEEVFDVSFQYDGTDRMAGETETFTHTFEDERVEAKIVIVKKDAETGTAQGKATLAGAVYGIYAREDISHPDTVTGVIYHADDLVTEVTTEAVKMDDGIYGVATAENLYLGKYYVKELEAPAGYLLDENEYDLVMESDGANHVETGSTEAKNIEVLEQSVESNENVIKLFIGKVSMDSVEAGSLLGNATLQLISADGSVYEEWISEAGKRHEIKGIPAGTYTLHEVTAPKGYAFAADMEITVEAKAEDQTYDMEDKPIEQHFKKTDAVTGKEIEGAKLSIYHAVNNDGKWERGDILQIDGEDVTWVSTKEEHVVKYIPAGEYILAEITAPSKEGYVTAQDIHFTVTAEMTVQETIEMKDEKSKVSVSKRDITNDQELPGANLVVKNADGNVVDSWTSTSEEHLIEGLVPGGTYTLTETAAPKGYQIASTITFTVSDSMEVQHVVMYDQPEKSKTPHTPILGIEDYTMVGGIVLLVVAALSLIGAAVLGRKKKK